MKYSLLALALLVAPADAGTVTLTVTTAGAPCAAGCSKTYTDSDANLAKLVATFQNDCNVRLNGTCSAVQVMAYWADLMISNTVAAVTGFDTNKLRDAASAGYTPIQPR